MNDTPAEREGDSTWARLRRRKVVQWGVVYVAAAWGFLQGLEYLSGTYDWPRQLQQLTTLVLLIGLPVVLVLAWYHGDRGQQRITTPEFAILTLLLLLGGGGFWYYQRANETPNAASTATQLAVPAVPPLEVAAAPDAKSIAVLPFVDMSAAKDQEYMSDGIAEELLNLLAKIPDLKVIARTSSFAFKGEKVEVAEIARKLNVAHVLEGSVRTSGNKLRITAQLIRTADSTHLWSETYDRTLEDIFALQDDIARQVANALRVTLLGSGQPAASVNVQDSEAHRLLLQGRYLAQNAKYDLALQKFQQAIERNAASAQTWVEIANAHMSQGDGGWVPPDKAYAAAREAIDKALAIDSNLGTALAAKSWLQAYDFEWDGALASLRKALALEPGNATVLLQAGWTLAEIDPAEEALALIEKSIELDPLQGRGYDIHSILLAALGRFAEAEGTCRKAQTLWPDAFAYTLSWTLLHQGRTDAALKEIEREADEAYRHVGLSYVYHTLGRKSDSDAALAIAKSKVPEDMKAYHVAELHAWRGEADRAFEWLDRAYDTHESQVTDIQLSADFQPLHADPRYKAFLKKMKFQQ